MELIVTNAPAWLDELPLDVGPAVHAMGTRALDPAMWLRPLAGDDELCSAKRIVLAEHRSDVVAMLDGSEQPVGRAVEAIAHRIGVEVVEGSVEEVAPATAEDLCILSPLDGRWVLVAGVVCFPSMWRLPDKLGLSMARVHEPVPRYVEELEARVDRFLDRLPVGRPAWRRNWFVHDVPDLFLPAPAHGPRPVDVPDGLWLRSERQTLMRVGEDVIVFSIRTQQAPLRVVELRPHLARRMGAAVAAWPDDIVRYRGAIPWRDEVAEWLAQRGATD